MRIEDIEIDESEKYAGKTVVNYVETMTGKLPEKRVPTVRLYQIGNVKEHAAKLVELLNNPDFGPVLVDNILGEKPGYIQTWTLGADKEHIREFQFGISDAGQIRQMLVESSEFELHNRWKYLIMEDFISTGPWPDDNVITSDIDSGGYGLQELTITWTEALGSWATDDGLCTPPYLVGDQVLLLAGNLGIYIGGYEWWGDYEVSCYGQVTIASGDMGIVLRYVDNNNYMCWRMVNETDVELIVVTSGSSETLVTVDYTYDTDTWYKLKVIAQGHKFDCYVEDELLAEVYNNEISAGQVGCWANQLNTGFDDYRVIALSPKIVNIPASSGRLNQYSVSNETTAHGIQRRLINPQEDISFPYSKVGDDCVLFYPIDEGVETPRCNSKYRNSATLTGCTWITACDNDDDYPVLSFNGSSDKLTVDDAANLDTDLSSVGVVIWDVEVKFDAVSDSTYHAIIMKDGCYYIQHNSSNQIQLYVYESGVDSDLTWTYGSNLVANVWYRMTFVWIEDDWMGIFVDGDLKASKSPTGGTLSVSADDLEIGGNTSNGRWFDGKIRNVKMYKAMKEDVIYGFDGTPATVFCFDDNNDTTARYRAVNLMYDLYETSRVYGTNRDWTGMPVVTNGHVMVTLRDINTDDVLWPIVWAWIENDWVLVGSLQVVSVVNGITIDIDEVDSSEWEIEEISDQFCRIRISNYIDSHATLPEGTVQRYWIEIRNGYPGVLIETEGDESGFIWDQNGYGYNGTDVWAYTVSSGLLDIGGVDGTTSYVLTDNDDNWLMSWNITENVVKILFADNKLDNGGNVWTVTDTSNVISDITSWVTRKGGIFFLPYIVSSLKDDIDAGDADETIAQVANLSKYGWNKCRRI